MEYHTAVSVISKPLVGVSYSGLSQIKPLVGVSYSDLSLIKPLVGVSYSDLSQNHNHWLDYHTVVSV